MVILHVPGPQNPLQESCQGSEERVWRVFQRFKGPEDFPLVITCHMVPPRCNGVPPRYNSGPRKGGPPVIAQEENEKAW